MSIDKLIADIEANSFVETNYDNRLISTERALEIVRRHELVKVPHTEQPVQATGNKKTYIDPLAVGAVSYALGFSESTIRQVIEFYKASEVPEHLSSYAGESLGSDTEGQQRSRNGEGSSPLAVSPFGSSPAPANDTTHCPKCGESRYYNKGVCLACRPMRESSEEDRERIKLHEMLAYASQVINDLLCIYADDMVGKDNLAEARQRISDRGVLGYIAAWNTAHDSLLKEISVNTEIEDGAS